VTRTSLGCELYHDLVPPQQRARVLDNLVANIGCRNNGHIDAGILGSKYILNALSENSRHDVACHMATRRARGCHPADG
jgi:alpha-L-rhamnosidase